MPPTTTNERFLHITLFSWIRQTNLIQQFVQQLSTKRYVGGSGVINQSTWPLLHLVYLTFALDVVQRFYLFSTREPPDPDSAEGSRDVFNEKPTAEELATVHAPAQVMWDKVAVLHTTFGDIQFKIFGDQCPKTAENFCTHARLVIIRSFIMCVRIVFGSCSSSSSSHHGWLHNFRNGYYDGTIFHR